MLPGSEEVDERNGQAWSQAGAVSAQAAFAQSQEGERAYDDFVRAAQSLVQRLRRREEQLAKLRKISEQINLGLTLDEVLSEAYFIEHPNSKATQLILREGMQSSLTCPLASKGKPVGFVFLSGIEKDTYSDLHVEFFEQIAAQLTVSVEKGRLYSELAKHKEAVKRQNAAMTRDLEMARSVQQALIPHGVIEIPGLDIAFRYEPAIQVGGDMLDILPLNDQKVLLFVGGATGHGVQAALVMCAVRMAVHAAVKSDPHPQAVLARVNEVLVHLCVESLVTVYIPKPDGKQRPLGIPTIQDRVIETAVLIVLEPIFEEVSRSLPHRATSRLYSLGETRDLLQWTTRCVRTSLPSPW